ncbi:MAG TPA: hypothetical protein VHF90_04115 [Thermoleophilaceae bacterium]|nr:hypothetical protein [Thermoleophilaceae bacterium]
MPLTRRLGLQDGFTTVTLMGAFAVGSLLVGVGFAAVDPDIGISRADQDYKQAYSAAEGGVQWYLSSLARDNGYYAQCTDVLDPNAQEQAPVNDVWDGTGPDPRIWRNLPGGDESQYTVELLPAPGHDECDPEDQYSMVDPNGNMRLRVTGRSRGAARSIVVTLRRRNFIDYIYFTHFETFDPLTYSSSGWRSWAAEHCDQFRDDREDEYQERTGQDYYCDELQFAPGDLQRGPVHTNDSIWVCGSSTFGRTARDSIELNGPAPGYVERGSCDASPNFLGTVTHPAGQLELPPSNVALKDIAADDYRFAGRTQIVLEGDSMQVNERNQGWQTLPLPGNGVVYVENDGSCSVAYARVQTYNAPLACGDAWIHGSYGADLTVAADNDVIVDGDLTGASESLLTGLIANGFVRVYHPVDHDNCASSSANLTGSLLNPTIEAAILSLNHSFIVDNWHCGTALGSLNVEGAIAQRYRGPVGTTGGSGYIKNYTYNDRLKFREPPFFLDPVQSAWRVARQNEQVPAHE